MKFPSVRVLTAIALRFTVGVLFASIVFGVFGFGASSGYAQIRNEDGIPVTNPAAAQRETTQYVKDLNAPSTSSTSSAGIDLGLLNSITSILNSVLNVILDFLGDVFLFVTWGVIKVGSYNSFLDSTAVARGWAICRDVANMFFIVIMLIIAVSTVLGNTKYGGRQNLMHLIFIAIFVNFSKTICGLIIDVSQVVMLTFMGAINDVGGGNFSALLGIPKLYAIGNLEVGRSVGVGEIFVSYMLAALFLVIAIVVVGVMFFTLLMRIISLWFLIALSPLAFLSSLTDRTKGHYAKWWNDLIQNAMVGPVLAFFLWLAFALVPNTQDGRSINIAGEISKGQSLADSGQLPTIGIALLGLWENVLGYAIGISMLIGGLMAAQEAGGKAGKLAGVWAGNIQGALTGKNGAGWNPIKGARDVGTGVYKDWTGRIEKRDKEFKEKYVAKALGVVGAGKEIPKKMSALFQTPKDRAKDIATRAKEIKALDEKVAAGTATQDEAKRLGSLQKKQQSAEWWNKNVYSRLDDERVIAGLTAGGALLAGGPIGLLPALIPLIQSLADSGSKDKKKATDFRHDETMKEYNSDGLKDLGSNDRQRILDEVAGKDPSLSDSQRDARALRAIEKGWMDANDAKKAIDDMKARKAQDKTLGKAKSLLFEQESKQLYKDLDEETATLQDVRDRFQKMKDIGIEQEDLDRLSIRLAKKDPTFTQDTKDAAGNIVKTAESKIKERFERSPGSIKDLHPDLLKDEKILNAILSIPKAIENALENPSLKDTLNQRDQNGQSVLQRKLAQFNPNDATHVATNAQGFQVYNTPFREAAETSVLASKSADKAAAIRESYGVNPNGGFTDVIKQNSFVEAIKGKNKRKILQSLDENLLPQQNDFSSAVYDNISKEVIETMSKSNDDDEKARASVLVQALAEQMGFGPGGRVRGVIAPPMAGVQQMRPLTAKENLWNKIYNDPKLRNL